MNLRKDSSLFGATRLVVENDDEESIFTNPPFEQFLDAVEAFAQARSVQDEIKLIVEYRGHGKRREFSRPPLQV